MSRAGEGGKRSRGDEGTLHPVVSLVLSAPTPCRYAFLGGVRFLVVLRPSGDLFLCAKYLFVAAMVATAA